MKSSGVKSTVFSTRAVYNTFEQMIENSICGISHKKPNVKSWVGVGLFFVVCSNSWITNLASLIKDSAAKILWLVRALQISHLRLNLWEELAWVGFPHLSTGSSVTQISYRWLDKMLTNAPIMATKLYSSACLLWVYLQIIFFLVHSQGASVIGSPSVLSSPAILQLDSPNTIGTIQGRKLTTLAWTVCWVGRFGSSPTWRSRWRSRWRSGCWSRCWSGWSFTSSLGYGENAPHCRSNLTKIINICISIFQSDNLLADGPNSYLSESCSTLRWPLFLFLSATRVSWVLPWDDPGQNRKFAFGIARVRLRIGSRWSEVPEETHRTSVISFYGCSPKKAGKAVLSYTQEIQHTKKIGPKGWFQPSSVAKAIYDGVYEAATANQMITRSLRKSK